MTALKQALFIAERDRLQKRKDQLVADLNGTIGALEQLDRMEKLLALAEPKAAPAVEPAPATTPEKSP